MTTVTFEGAAIKPLQESDLESVMSLECSAHSHPWAESNMRSSLRRHLCWGLWHEEDLLGFAIFSCVVGEAELLDLVIAPAQQGQGLGGRFLAALLPNLEQQAERLFLEVRESNQAAIALYSSCGFVEVGVRKGYYPSGQGREDALLMALEWGDKFCSG